MLGLISHHTQMYPGHVYIFYAEILEPETCPKCPAWTNHNMAAQFLKGPMSSAGKLYGDSVLIFYQDVAIPALLTIAVLCLIGLQTCQT